MDNLMDVCMDEMAIGRHVIRLVVDWGVNGWVGR